MRDEKQKSAERRWYVRNTEAKKAYSRRWYAANKERVAEQRRQWRLANPGKKADQNRRSHGLPEPPYARPDACECCGRPAWLEKTVLVLDHDHTTNEFRGWICNSCNLGLGKLGDNIAGIEKALAYLTRGKP